MGWTFDLRYANVVLYLTSPDATEVPRLTGFQLQEFFASMQGEYRDRPPLISNEPRWVEMIVEAARYGSRSLNLMGPYGDDFLDPWVVERLLQEIRFTVSKYTLYGLPIGTQSDGDRLRAFAEQHMQPNTMRCF